MDFHFRIALNLVLDVLPQRNSLDPKHSRRLAEQIAIFRKSIMVF